MTRSKDAASAAARKVEADSGASTARVGSKFLKAALRSDVKREFVLGMRDADATIPQLAIDLEEQVSRVGRMRDPNEGDQVHVAHVPQMPRALALRLARWAVGHHGALVIDAPAVVECSEAERTYRLTREANEFATVRAENLRDGDHDIGELEAELKEAREFIAALLEHEANLAEKLAAKRGGGR